MTTAADLINLAARDSGVLGVGQTFLAQDTADALRRLNNMIAQWNRRRWLVYHLVDTARACTGAVSYSVGAGQNFNIARPDRLEWAYIRQTVPVSSTPVDWTLTILPSYEDYAKITLKRLAASPSQYIFYDSGYPYGTVYPWPVPNSQYELHIVTKAVLQSFATTADTVALPPEYEDAINYNLQVRFRAAYRLPPDPMIIGLARAALATLRKSNMQVNRSSMPRGITRGPAYNIYSDFGN